MVGQSLEGCYGSPKDIENALLKKVDEFPRIRRKLPSNRTQVVKYLATLCRMLEKKPEITEHIAAFMRKIFEAGLAEQAPLLSKEQECWFIAIFGVYHLCKPGQLRAVFDSSAKHNDVSLNILLSGPDLNNTLLGVLTLFRKESVAMAENLE